MHDDPDNWGGLRRRLRDHIARQRASRHEVAVALGIGFPTLVRVLSADSECPGRQVIERAQAFLASRHESPSHDTTVSASGADGAAPSEPGKGMVLTTTASGNGAASAPNRLGEAGRDRLLGYLELTPERQVRNELRITGELAREAAAGAEIPPEAVQRITEFFEAAPG